MSALPRPELAPGPSKALNDALHDLHHRAGWPSLRTLARETGVSHTTVSKAMSHPALPPWGTVEVLVETMGGSVEEFHQLWLAASTPTNGTAPPAPRIAGRRAELVAVRRHLETGTGLLLVTGEAGIGKTSLVTAAAASSNAFVAVGRCRPLSSPVPLLPVADLLRSVLEADAEWFHDSLGASPAYAAPALTPLIPELGAPPDQGPASEFARQRLLSALSALLAQLSEARPFAVVMEDLPWADSATLDLIELLATRDGGASVVATWRTDDSEGATSSEEWRSRVGRASEEIRLGPLSRAETGEQLAILHGHDVAHADVARIYERSQGQPFFTEQLATSSPSPGELPPRLDDALSRRLAKVDASTWPLVRALGIADRPLTVAQLARAAGFEADPVPAVRALVSQRLATVVEDGIALHHPLIAEAVRHGLVPGEAIEVHRRLADMLAELDDPPAAEVAGHLRAAGTTEGELLWRVRAALSSEARYSPREAFPQWSRALELWPAATVIEDEHQVDLAEAHTRAIDSAIGARQDVSALRRLVEEAMAADLPEQGRADVLLRAGDLECAIGDLDKGLAYLDEAVAINDRHPPTSKAVHVLEVRANINSSLGRSDVVRRDIARGLAMSESLRSPDMWRRMLALSARQLYLDGDARGARARAAEATAVLPPDVDPPGYVRVAAFESEILLDTGASPGEVVAATAGAVALIEAWGLTGVFAEGVVADVGWAHLRAGDVEAAHRAVASKVDASGLFYMMQIQTVWCAVQVARGEVEAAVARLEALFSLDNYAAGAAHRDHVRADALLWSGRAVEAIECLDRALEFVCATDLARDSAALFVTRARAAADHVDATGAGVADREAAARLVDQLRRSSGVDPFGPAGLGVDCDAQAAQWNAELARIQGRDHAERWNRAAASFDALGRPHDAAYCRWRAAQCALRDGQGTVAARLLKKAAAEAREHVPLSEAIAATRAGAA